MLDQGNQELWQKLLSQDEQMREDFSRSQTKLRNDFSLENDSVRQEYYAESKVLQHRLEKHCSQEILKAM